MFDPTPLTRLLVATGQARASAARHGQRLDIIALHPDTHAWMAKAATACYAGRTLDQVLELRVTDDPQLAAHELRGAGHTHSLRGA